MKLAEMINKMLEEKNINVTDKKDVANRIIEKFENNKKTELV